MVEKIVIPFLNIYMTNAGTGSGYGSLAWCRGGAVMSNGMAENWFEWLDCLYDTNSNPGLPDLNGYFY